MLRNKGGSKLLQVPNNVDWRKSIFNFYQYDLSLKPAALVAIGPVTNTVAQVEYRCLCRYIWLLCQS